jgi:hypothetical protein
MQAELKRIDFDSLVNPMVKFIRSNPTRRMVKDPVTGNIITDDQGKIVYRKKGGKKIGVLVAGVHPHKDYKIIVGFSMCCKKDKYNWITTGGGRTKIDGFGKKVATKRAMKWEDYDKVWIGKLPDEIKPDPEGLVVIPDSISVELGSFLGRCAAYYKDKEAPVWVESMTIANKIETSK